MRRHLFALVSAISFALAIALESFWARSYRHAKSVEFTRHKERWELRASRGKLLVGNEPQLKLEAMRRQQELNQANTAFLTAIHKADLEADAISRSISARDYHRETQRLQSKASLEALKRAAYRFDAIARQQQTSPPRAAVFHSMPIAIPILPLIALPAIWLRLRIRTRRRIRGGLCLACGYDLRASPTQCPECGKIPTTIKSSNTLVAHL